MITLYKNLVRGCRLEHDIIIMIVLNWFKVNLSTANLKKFQFMVLGGKKSFQYKCKIEGTYIFSKDRVLLLEITINNKT